ncbi:MAG: response regulator transcription factor [Gemmatimonadaceae bacterium]
MPDGLPSVFVADDHALLRRGLIEVIRQSRLYDVVGEAEDGESALAGIRQHRPAMAIVDVEMPRRNGIAVAEALRGDEANTAVVLLTMHDDPETLERAIAAGVRGYVLKDGALTDILTCLNLVSAGRMYVSAALSSSLVERGNRATAAAAQGGAILDRLSPAERKVLRLVARNLTTVQIAADLALSPKTVENHRARISARLQLHGPQALLRFALEHRAELE